jgi:leucyl aminopeptidase (aminopeptidase T)
MKIKDGEEVLIITDEERLGISKAVSEVAKKNGAKVSLIILTNEIRPVKELNAATAFAIKKADVVLTIMDGIAEETPFRLQVIDLAVKNKARLGHMPGVEERMLVEGGLRADYNQVKKISDSMLAKMKGKKELHVTAPGGTDLHINLGNRKWIEDSGLYHKKGVWGNLPAGEVFIAPLEDGVDGVLVVDGSTGFFGMPKHPIRIRIDKGRMKEIKCKDKQTENRIRNLIFKESDSNAQFVAELGIGTNNFAKLTGNLLEDEKVYGTAHIAFGDNQNMGGKNKSKIHIDMIFKKPKFE